jgi:hypothetical protein
MFIIERNGKPEVWFAGSLPAAEAVSTEADCKLVGLGGGGGCIGGGGGGCVCGVGIWKENEPMPMPGVAPRILPMMFEMKLKRLPACGWG